MNGLDEEVARSLIASPHSIRRPHSPLAALLTSHLILSLKKTSPNGPFIAEIAVTEPTSTLLFKFVVNGEWTTGPADAGYETLVDGEGNVNNVLRLVPAASVSAASPVVSSKQQVATTTPTPTLVESSSSTTATTATVATAATAATSITPAVKKSMSPSRIFSKKQQQSTVTPPPPSNVAAQETTTAIDNDAMTLNEEISSAGKASPALAKKFTWKKVRKRPGEDILCIS